MSKYGTSSRRPPPPKRDRIPPLVRGIGCLLFVLMPILAYGLADWLVPIVARWVPIPPQWFSQPRFMSTMRDVPFLSDFLELFRDEPNLTVNLVFTAILTILLYGIITMAFGYMYSFSAPSQLGPMDVPPPRVKTKKYRR